MSIKKVLFVMHLPPPVHGASVMGKAIYDSQLVNQSFDCRFINLSASENVSDVGKLSFGKIFFLIKSTFNIVSVAYKFRPDLCYVTPSSWDWGFYRDYILISLLKLLNVPVIAHFHNKAPKEWMEKPLNKFLNRRFYKGIKIILLSEELYREKQPFIGREDVFICPNGVEAIQSSPKQLSVEGKKFNFLFLSNMMREKGVYILLEAIKYLKNKGASFECHFVGKWADIKEADFQEYVDKNGLQSVAFAHGAMYNDEKNAYFIAADAFVFPTYYHGEAFPLVLLEAMQFGLPCISTTEGGIPGIVNDLQTGFLIEPKDWKALAEKMELLINDPERGSMMGEAGRIRFHENFTLNKFENRFVDILQQTLSKEIHNSQEGIYAMHP